MRWKPFSVAMATVLALALCQKSTTESDEQLNLDPTIRKTTENRNSGPASSYNVTECTLEDGTTGVCVTYYLCDQDTKRVIEDGYTIIDIRAQSECPQFLEVCCKLGGRVTTTTPAPHAKDDRLNARPSAGADHSQPVIPEYQGSVTPFPRPSTSRPMVVQDEITSPPVSADRSTGVYGSCGYSNPGAHVLSDRIGGDESDRLYADFGEFPWMVAILKLSNEVDSDRDVFISGGSLIHTSVVMTVAHRVAGRNPDKIKIRAGEWMTNSEDELYRHQDREVTKVVVHEKFLKLRAHNDVGLLFLKSPVILQGAPHIGIGCLAPQPPPPGTICFSMGWGATNFQNKSVFASIPKKVKLPALANDRCEEMLRKTRLGHKFSLHPSLLCAGGEEGVDTCVGDGGSSLVCPINSKGSRFAIYGMVAYGVGCGEVDVPGVYVNTSTLYEWIGLQLSYEGLDKPYVY